MSRRHLGSRRWLYPGLLLAVLVVSAVVNLAWLDRSTYVSTTIPHDEIIGVVHHHVAIHEYGERPAIVPPLIVRVAAWSGATFGKGYGRFVAPLTGWLLVLIVALFLTGRRLAGDLAGWVSAVAAAGMPGIFGNARVFSDQLQNMTCGAVCVCALVYSRQLTRPVYAVLYATVLIYLSGQTFLHTDFYLCLLSVSGPTAFVVFSALRRISAMDNKERLAVVASIVIIAATAITLAIAPAKDVVTYYLGQAMSSEYVLDETVTWSQRAMTYPHVVVWAVLGWPMAAVGLFALGMAVGRRTSEGWLALLWVVVPLLLLSLIVKKHPWYMLPSCPAWALCVGVAVSAFKKVHARRRNAYALIVVAVAMGQLVVFSTVATARIPDLLRNHLQSPDNVLTTFAHPPRHEEPEARRIALATLEAVRGAAGDTPARIVFSTEAVHGVIAYLLLEDSRHTVLRLPRPAELQSICDGFDFLVRPTLPSGSAPELQVRSFVYLDGVEDPVAYEPLLDQAQALVDACEPIRRTTDVLVSRCGTNRP